MKKTGFSFVEIIISLALTLFLLIPTLKINTQQILNFQKFGTASAELDFFDSIYSYLKNDNIFFMNDNNFNFKSYEDLKRISIFQNFELNKPPLKPFNLKIIVKVINIDFYSSINKVNIIEIEFSTNKRQLKTKIIKFIN